MNSFFAYRGGKSKLAKTIVSLIPEHTCYCEVFAGAAWILFNKEPSKVEIINDINSELVTLYRVIQNHLEEFLRYMKWILVSREEFERFKTEAAETLTDIQRAVRYYYLLKCGFGGRVRSPSYGISPSGPPGLNLMRIEEELSAAHLRLARVYIENKSYAQLIQAVDRPYVVFYIDPPYYGNEDDYGKGIFHRDDFGILRDILKCIDGKFILSVNDRPETREIFKDFNIQEVKTRYTQNNYDNNCQAAELLVTNYDSER